MYSSQFPELLSELVNTPEMKRLSGIGMHCGCEYTDVPIYKHERYQYSRLTHSIGVAKIVLNFTGDTTQAAAGLLHDIATPVFSHTIDFLNDDHMTQESTEDKTGAIIKNSTQIMALLDKHRIHMDDVCDYHKYPIADNDTPMLSADRLEYSFGVGHLIQLYELDEIRGMYEDLTVLINEHGAPELCFKSFPMAKAFAQMMLKNSLFFVTDEDRFSMQLLADIIKRALKAGVLTADDLHTTESEVIGKLKENRETNRAWSEYTKISSVSTSPGALCDRYCVNISAKKRYIDPLVFTESGLKRISAIDADLKKGILDFLDMDFNYWIYSS